MTQLINKGGFRERANRSRRYQQSENEQTQLPPNGYQPQRKQQNENVKITETTQTEHLAK